MLVTLPSLLLSSSNIYLIYIIFTTYTAEDAVSGAVPKIHGLINTLA